MPHLDHPLNLRREPSALEGWILEFLLCDPGGLDSRFFCCDPKGCRAFLRIHVTNGDEVDLRWGRQHLNDLKGPQV